MGGRGDVASLDLKGHHRLKGGRGGLSFFSLVLCISEIRVDGKRGKSSPVAGRREGKTRRTISLQRPFSVHQEEKDRIFLDLIPGSVSQEEGAGNSPRGEIRHFGAFTVPNRARKGQWTYVYGNGPCFGRRPGGRKQEIVSG